MTIDDAHALRQMAIHGYGLGLGYANAGIHEVGENSGSQIEFWQSLTGGKKGDPWCADFVYGCLLKAWCQTRTLLTGMDNHDYDRGLMLYRAEEFSLSSGVPRTGSCKEIEAAARRLGRWREKHSGTICGDLVLFDFHGVGESHHVGFVQKSFPDGSLMTIEGNTSSGVAGSQSDGDGVYKRSRPLTHVRGFVHF